MTHVAQANRSLFWIALTGYLGVVVLLPLLGVALLVLSERREVVTCASLGTKGAALAALSEHPRLDADGDGDPCEIYN
jgi:hypothetical protein